jgi:hypothetical protein
MDTPPSWVGSGRDWIIVGVGFLLLSALIEFASYISFPPDSLITATGTVMSVNHRFPSRSPKLNIFIDDGRGVLHLYTDLGVIRTKVNVGDVVQAGFDKDIFGRNSHRMWDLRRGNEVLLSKEKSFPAAAAEARQIGWLALYGSVASLVVIAVGVGLQVCFRPTP